MKGEQLNAMRRNTGTTMIEMCCALGITPTRWSKIIKKDVVPAQIQLCSKFIEPLPGNAAVREFVLRMHNYGLTLTAISEMLCLHASAASRIAKGGNATLTTRQLVRKLDADIKSKKDADYWLAVARTIKKGSN